MSLSPVPPRPVNLLLDPRADRTSQQWYQQFNDTLQGSSLPPHQKVIQCHLEAISCILHRIQCHHAISPYEHILCMLGCYKHVFFHAYLADSSPSSQMAKSYLPSVLDNSSLSILKVWGQPCQTHESGPTTSASPYYRIPHSEGTHLLFLLLVETTES